MTTAPRTRCIPTGSLATVVAALALACAGVHTTVHAAGRAAQAGHVIDASVVRPVGLKEELEKLKAKVHKDKGAPPAPAEDPAKAAEGATPSPAPAADKPAGAAAAPACDHRRDLVIEMGNECSNKPNRQVIVVNKTSRVIMGTFRTFQRLKDGSETPLDQRGGIGARDRSRQLCGMRAEVLACEFMN